LAGLDHVLPVKALLKHIFSFSEGRKTDLQTSAYIHIQNSNVASEDVIKPNQLYMKLHMYVK